MHATVISHIIIVNSHGVTGVYDVVYYLIKYGLRDVIV